jgi:hypothetical protein
MDDDSTAQRSSNAAKTGTAPKSASDARRERLAAQLKANLKRRKQQARGRSDVEDGQN